MMAVDASAWQSVPVRDAFTSSVAVAATLLTAIGLGLWHRRRDGLFRPVAPAGPAPESLAAPESLVAAVPRRPEPAASAVSEPPDPSAGAGQADGAETRAVLTALGVRLGTPATLLQFSSAFCAPCRATRRVLAEVAVLLDGVRHLEVDAESHLAAVRTLGIWRTPTVLVVDAEGRVVRRAVGVPRKAQVIAAVAPLLGDATP